MRGAEADVQGAIRQRREALDSSSPRGGRACDEGRGCARVRVARQKEDVQAAGGGEGYEQPLSSSRVGRKCAGTFEAGRGRGTRRQAESTERRAEARAAGLIVRLWHGRERAVRRGAGARREVDHQGRH